MIQSNKFRWFQYKKGELRVIIGNGRGLDKGQCDSTQVLRKWKRDFASFHGCCVPPTRKKPKRGFFTTYDRPFDRDVGDWFGFGGPVALAIRSRWLFLDSPMVLYVK